MKSTNGYWYKVVRVSFEGAVSTSILPTKEAAQAEYNLPGKRNASITAYRGRTNLWFKEFIAGKGCR